MRGQTASGSGAPATQKAGAPTTRAAPTPTGKAGPTPKAGTTTPPNQNGTTQNQKTSGNTPPTNSQGAGTQGPTLRMPTRREPPPALIPPRFPLVHPKPSDWRFCPKRATSALETRAAELRTEFRLPSQRSDHGRQRRSRDNAASLLAAARRDVRKWLRKRPSDACWVSRNGSSRCLQGWDTDFNWATKADAQISQIRADSVADAGLRVGDQVVSINGQAVSSDSSLRSQLSQIRDSKIQPRFA